MLDIKLEVNVYFRIRNSKLYSEKESVHYSMETMRFDTSDTETQGIDLNIPLLLDEHIPLLTDAYIECLAEEHGVTVDDVESISREEYTKCNLKSDTSDGKYDIEAVDYANALRVNVDDGYIMATVSQDSDYPGIIVEFVSDDDNGQNASRPTVRLEKILGENPRALIWEDKKDEDYTTEIEFEN